MRVLILNQPFHPDVVATAQIAKDLADDLVARGHDVTAIASTSVYGQSGATLPAREEVDGIHVRRVGAAKFGKGHAAGRVLDFAGYYARAVAEALHAGPFDVVVCLTTPPFLVYAGLLLKRAHGSRTVYWVMDVYPDVMVAEGMLAGRSALERALRAVDAWAIRQADVTVALGRCMRDRLIEHGAPEDRVRVIPVWSPAPTRTKTPKEENVYRREWKTGDRMLVMYSGNFGLAHDVQTYLDAAKRLEGDPRFQFAFVGGGKRKEEVERFVRVHGLEGTSCILLGYQPRARLGELLQAADVHLVTMRPGMEGLVVPSKFYGVAGAARPVIFVGPAGSEIARSIEEWGCGARIAPGDVDGLVRELQSMADAPGRLVELGENAFRGFEAHASRAIAAGRLIAEIEG